MPWKAEVYHPKEGDMPEDWAEIREIVLDRDGYRCQACWIRHKRHPNRLQAHHILPRSEGGTNDLHNLCTLCHVCHDLIEPYSRQLPSVRAIRRFWKDYETGTKSLSESLVEADSSLKNGFGENPNQTWQAMVYGGQRANPRK